MRLNDTLIVKDEFPLFFGDIRRRELNTLPVNRLSQQSYQAVIFNSNVIVMIWKGRVWSVYKTSKMGKQNIYPISEASQESFCDYGP